MAQVKVIEIWDAQFQAQPEMKFVDDDGKAVVIEASGARTGRAALVELQDGSGVRTTVEIPEGYNLPIAVDDVLHVQCKALAIFERYMRVKHVLRHIKAGKKGGA